AADDEKASAKTASQPQTGDKAQAATGAGDTDSAIQARAHHGADAQTSASATTDKAAAPNTGADPSQTSALTTPAQNTTPTATNVSAAPQIAPQAVAIPLAGVAVEIAAKAQAGTNHFEIRLDPPELGKIEVRLDVDKDGNVTSRMIADRSDTLDLLRRDASGLERALQDAGLKTADNSLQFSLRDQSNGQQQSSNPDTARLIVQDNTPAPIEILQRSYGRLAGQGSGIDIHV
ncbi:MAG: flagellar hook-length control protein FliK, partial [Pseudolabrys sp.]